MPANIQVTDQASRKAMIDSQVQSTARSQKFPYKDRVADLPVVRIPLGLPIYRMANTRTEVEQLSYIADHDLAADYFSVGEENRSVQMAQHNLLLGMSKRDTGPIYQELELRREQTEPLLITTYGVVVNGNRRLAAMRDLYASDAQLFHAFSHVDAMVLPVDADALDLEIIETELQMVPETKLEYGWIEQRLKLRHFRDDRQLPLEQIRALMRFRKPEEVNRYIQELELAEEYLAGYRQTPRAYKAVEKSEQVFHELAERLRKKGGDDRDIARQIGFVLISESERLGTRVYDLREAFGKYSSVVARRLTDEFRLSGAAAQAAAPMQAADDDPLGQLGTPANATSQALQSLLADPTNGAAVAQAVLSIHQDIKEEQRVASIRGAALANVERAHRSLAEVDLSVSDNDSFEAIAAQLDAILQLATQLRARVSELSEDDGQSFEVDSTE